MKYEAPLYEWKALGSSKILTVSDTLEADERAKYAGWATWLSTYYPDWCLLSLHWHIWNAPIYDLFTRKMREAIGSMERIILEELFTEPTLTNPKTDLP